MPCSVAWDVFGEANGTASLDELRSTIARYHKVDPVKQNDFQIGCRILTQPFSCPRMNGFLFQKSWTPNIVRYKRYSTEQSEGLKTLESSKQTIETVKILFGSTLTCQNS